MTALRAASSDSGGKRVSGVNLCPKECLCARKDVEITYKVGQAKKLKPGNFLA